MVFAFLLLVGVHLFTVDAWAIQGCTLRDPDKDIRRTFPEATDYRSHFISVKERGGAAMQITLARRLDNPLDPVYEAMDIPYAYYEILKGKKVIGYVFGVNQKGKYGGMQLIVAADLSGKIKNFYFQKLSNPERNKFMSPDFTNQFKGLTLADFYYHQGYQKLGKKRKEDKVDSIKPPGASKVALHDFRATLRGIMKSLILFDLFWQKDKNGNIFTKIQAVIMKKGAKKP